MLTCPECSRIGPFRVGYTTQADGRWLRGFRCQGCKRPFFAAAGAERSLLKEPRYLGFTAETDKGLHQVTLVDIAKSHTDWSVDGITLAVSGSVEKRSVVVLLPDGAEPFIVPVKCSVKHADLAALLQQHAPTVPAELLAAALFRILH